MTLSFANHEHPVFTLACLMTSSAFDFLQDNRAEYDGSVRNACGCIISFVYGTDGFDACKIERQCIEGLDWSLDEMRKRYACDVDNPAVSFEQQLTMALDVQSQLWKHRTRLRLQINDMCALPFNLKYLTWNASDRPATADEIWHIVRDLVEWIPPSLLTLRYAVLVSLRCCKLLRLRVDKPSIERVACVLKEKIQLATISPGEMVGCIAAQSVVRSLQMHAIHPPKVRLTLHALR